MRYLQLRAGQQGILLVLGYVALSSANAVYLSGFLGDADVFGTLLAVFTATTTVFCGLAMKRDGLRIRWSDRRIYRGLIWVNLTTAGSWFSFYFAVRSIEPALTSVIGNAVMPLTTLLFAAVVLGSLPRSKKELAAAVALLLCMLGTGWVVFSGQTSHPNSAPVIGFAASVLCGMSVALNTVVSKRLNALGLTTLQILATRFFLLLALAAALTDWSHFGATLKEHYVNLLALAIVGNLIPLFCLQAGIARVRPIVTSFLIGLSPLVYLLFQAFTDHIAFVPASAACIAVSTIAIVYGVIVSHSSETPLTVRATSSRRSSCRVR